MSNRSSSVEVLPSEDGSIEQPVPTAWRPVFREIVRAFAQQNYRLLDVETGAEALSLEAAARIRGYIEDYGAVLTELPEDTWESSVCVRSGKHWSVLVDLWTQSEGRSDLVLSARVVAQDSGFVFKNLMVYVP